MHRELMDWRLVCFRSLLGFSVVALPIASSARAAADEPASVAAGQPVDAATKKLMAANGLFQRSLFKLAGDQYGQFLKENPDHPEATAARYALAICHYRLGEFQPAITQLRQVLTDAKFDQRDEALALLGYCELSDKQYDAALKDLAELAEKYPKSKQAEQGALYRAQTLYLAGKPKEAADACTAFLQQYPKSEQGATAVYFLALSQKQNGQNAEAVQSLEKLVKDYPNSRYQLDAELLAGQALEAQGKFAEAAERYRQMVATAPETRKADALYSLGLALYKGGKYEASLQPLGSVVKDFPTSAYAKPAKLQLGLAALAAGKTADARSTLAEVVKDDPSRAAEAQYGLAQCDITDKKFDAARATLDALAKTQPPPANLSQVLLDRAVCLMELTKFDDAAREFEALATRYPKSPQLPEALYREAFCLHKLSKYDASHAVCEQFAKLSAAPGDLGAPVAELDAENLFLLVKYPEAEKAFDALAASTKDETRQLRFKLRAGQCEYFAGNYPRAVERLQPLAADPRVAQADDLQPAIFLLGDAQLQQGKNTEAAAALKQFVTAAKGDKREAQFKLGLAQMRGGDAAGAQVTLTALAQSPAADSPWVQRGLFELGQLQYKAGQGDAARASLGKALAAKPPAEVAAPASYLLGWVDYDAKKYPQAAATWGEMAQTYAAHPLAADAAFQQGVALKEAGSADPALTALQRFTAAHPESPNAIKARQLAASILASQGKGEESAKMLAELAKDPKASDTVLYDLAWAQRGQKDNAAAAETYRRLIKNHADSKLAPAVRTELAELLYADKKYEESTPLLEAVVADTSADAKIQSAAAYRLAWCYQKLNKSDKAAVAFGDFAARHPDDELAPSAMLQAGLAAADAGTMDVAEKTLADLLARHPDHKDAPVAMLKLAEVQAAQNRFDASLATDQQFLQKYPKDSFAYRAQFGVGWALENLKKYDDARGAYQKVIASTNGETAARAQFQTGETYLAEQKFEQAIPALLAVEDVYAYPKWSARALFEAGRAFEQLKQLDQAKQQYTQLVTKYKDAPEAGLAQDRLKTIKGS